MNIAGIIDGTSRLYTSDPNGVSGGGDTGGYVLKIGYSPTPLPPAITSQPTNQLIASGATTTFAVTSFGLPPFSYQWFFNDFDHPLNGATNSSLTLANVQTNQTGNYFVQVTSVADQHKKYSSAAHGGHRTTDHLTTNQPDCHDWSDCDFLRYRSRRAPELSMDFQ